MNAAICDAAASFPSLCRRSLNANAVIYMLQHRMHMLQRRQRINKPLDKSRQRHNPRVACIMQLMNRSPLCRLPCLLLSGFFPGSSFLLVSAQWLLSVDCFVLCLPKFSVPGCLLSSVFPSQLSSFPYFTDPSSIPPLSLPVLFLVTFSFTSSYSLKRSSCSSLLLQFFIIWSSSSGLLALVFFLRYSSSDLLPLIYLFSYTSTDLLTLVLFLFSIRSYSLDLLAPVFFLSSSS